MTFLNELSDVLSLVFRLIPRIHLVNPDESGVRVTLGTRVVDTPPGWYVFWPLIQTSEKINVRTQVVDLRAQSVWTVDRVDLTISAAIRYKVHNARKALLDVLNYDDNIQALALGIIRKHIDLHTVDDLDTEVLIEKIREGLREACQGWGLRIEAVYITDIGRTQNFRLLLNEPILKVGE